MAENWARRRLRQNTGAGFTGRQSRGRRRRAACLHLAAGLPPAEQKLPAGWLGPSPGEEVNRIICPERF